MDIYSKNKYPSNELSNFAEHHFEIDYIKCKSMEGFLQSLKVNNIEEQINICQLIGYKAKLRGSTENWQKTQTLYWNNKEINRLSDEYQSLIDRAYECMYNQCEDFRKALLATGKTVLTHSVGNDKPMESMLTEKEFISKIIACRNKLIKKLF